MNESSSAVILIPRGADPQRDAYRNFWANIHWRTLHCLIETSGHLAISELARKASLSIDETVRALEAMEILGFIQKTDKGYKQLVSYYKRETNSKTEQMDMLADYFVVSHQITNKILGSEDPDGVFTKRVLYTSSAKVVDELAKDINEAVEKFKKNSEQTKETWDGVYAISVALTPMTKEV